MYYSITSSCIREIKNGVAPTTFSGSSSFAANNAHFVEKKQTKRPSTPRVIPTAAPSVQPSQAAAPLATCRSDRTYKINRPVVRGKINAFFNLQATREFCAFYSISFPCGISDNDAFKLFNLWQTRCRQSFSLKSFIWVAERQQNGTIHFHILTNTRMPIKRVNGFMRTALLPYCCQYGWSVAKVSKYNGIDVDNVWYSKRRNASGCARRRSHAHAQQHLSLYVTKYVSKNRDTFSHLAWHESRDIAALFTAHNFDVEECEQIISYFLSTKKFWKKFDGEFVAVYLHPTVYDLTPYTQITAVNENVYRKFHAQITPT